MRVSGQCPVQGSEIRDGWLFYFRARGGWDLEAWAPGRWSTPTAPGGMAKSKWCDQDDPADLAATHMAEAGSDATIVIDESASDRPGFPLPPDGEETYPGWWSHEYATAVAEWAIAEAMKRGVTGIGAGAAG